MKTAQYIDTYYPTIDGVVITVSNYHYWLNQNHGSNMVFTIKNGQHDDYGEVYRCKSANITGRAAYPLPLPFLDFKYKKLQKENLTDVDLIHAHSPFFTAKQGYKFAKKYKIPFVITFHSKFYDEFLKTTKSVFISKLMLRNTLRIFNKADYVWAVNHNTAQTLRDYGFKGKIEVMPNGVDMLPPVNKIELCQLTRSELNISQNENVLLFVGQQDFKKNIAMIYDSLALCKANGLNFKFISVGIGDDSKEIKKLGEKLGIDQNIIYPGKIFDREKLKSIYSAADLFVFPSLYDNAPLVLREAAVCSCPSVVVENSGSAEGIQNNINGFTCQNNAQSLSQAIISALKNPNLPQIAQKASQTIPINWEEIVKKVNVRYCEIVEEYTANNIV